MNSATNKNQEMPTKPGKCRVCSVPASRFCSSCSVACYCSPEHQKKDWKTHKKDCKACTLVKIGKIGYFYTAARNLGPGELVLTDIPPTYGPVAENECALAMESRTCFGCNIILQHGSTYRCSKCTLPVCSSTCEKIVVHADNECKIFEGNHSGAAAVQLRDLLYLRMALLKKYNPSAFKEIMMMQIPEEITRQLLEMAKYVLKTMLHEVFQISDIVTPDEWIKIVNVARTNVCFSCEGVEQPNGRLRGSHWAYLNIKMAHISNSCYPNCFLRCSPSPNMKMIVTTAAAVKKGEILTCNYRGEDYSNFGNYRRQRFNEGRACKCLRCTDPTEMGSHLSTVACQSCKSVTMVSMDPLQENAKWKCYSCGAVVNGRIKIKMMDEFFKMIENMDLDQSGKEPVEKLIKMISGTTFHPNNWVLVQAHIKLADFLEGKLKRGDAFEDGELDLYASTIERLIKVVMFVSPEICAQKARLQCSLASALLWKLCLYQPKCPTTTEEEPVVVVLDRVNKLFMEGNKYYKLFRDAEEYCNEVKVAKEIEIKLFYVKFVLKEMATPQWKDDDEAMKKLRLSNSYKVLLQLPRDEHDLEDLCKKLSL